MPEKQNNNNANILRYFLSAKGLFPLGEKAHVNQTSLFLPMDVAP